MNRTSPWSTRNDGSGPPRAPAPHSPTSCVAGASLAGESGTRQPHRGSSCSGCPTRWRCSVWRTASPKTATRDGSSVARSGHRPAKALSGSGRAVSGCALLMPARPRRSFSMARRVSRSAARSRERGRECAKQLLPIKTQLSVQKQARAESAAAARRAAKRCARLMPRRQAARAAPRPRERRRTTAEGPSPGSPAHQPAQSAESSIARQCHALNQGIHA